MLLQFLFLTAASVAIAVPARMDGPQPGQSSYYSTYRGRPDAFPANVTKAVKLRTSNGPSGANDLLF
jgi:hypothetical protein